MPELTPLTAAGVVAALLLGPAIGWLVGAWRGDGGPATTRLAASVTAVGTAVASLVLLVTGLLATGSALDPRLGLLVAALGGLFAVLATVAVHELAGGTARVLAFAGLSTAAVYVPVAIAVLSTSDGVLGATLATLDLGGALPVLVAAGSVGAAVLVAERRSPRTSDAPPRRAVIPAFAAVWVLWIVWLVAAELAIDPLTPGIVVNALVAPPASAVVWLIVQRVRHARTSAVGLVGGLFTGLVSVTAGAGFLDVFGAVIVGAVGGAVSSLIGYAVARRTGRPAWLLPIVLVVAGGVGTLLLGLLATRGGLMFTGQPEVISSQGVSVGAVIAYSLVVGLLLRAGQRVVLRHRAPARERVPG